MLAERLGWTMAEGDRLHPPENVEKMRRGVPLDDADRWPWLDRIGALLKAWAAEGRLGRRHLLGAQAQLSRTPARRPAGPALRLPEGIRRR